MRAGEPERIDAYKGNKKINSPPQNSLNSRPPVPTPGLPYGISGRGKSFSRYKKDETARGCLIFF